MLYGQYDNIEIWKRHPVYLKHSCSTFGRVRHDERLDSRGRRWAGIVLTPRKNSSGNWTVQINGYGRRREHNVGRLVLETFCGPHKSGEECCHGPNGRGCHELSNLSWGTSKKNQGHDRERDGTSNKGSRQGTAKLTEKEAIKIFHDRRSQQKIASEYNVSRQNVSHIKTGKSWNHVTGMPKKP